MAKRTTRSYAAIAVITDPRTLAGPAAVRRAAKAAQKKTSKRSAEWPEADATDGFYAEMEYAGED